VDFYDEDLKGNYKILDYFVAQGRKSRVEDLQKNKRIQYIFGSGSGLTMLA